MTTKNMSAGEALDQAHRIAFAPFVFQATVCLKKFGILDFIFENREHGGPTAQEIADSLSISKYGVNVLLEIALSSNILSKNTEKQYELTKTGYFLNFHNTVGINLNFAHHVCYKALFHLKESIRKGEPAGLKELGEWNTIYEGLSQLPPVEQKSWFEFDHHYSDDIFEDALRRIFRYKPEVIFDVGSNTGKFSIACCNYDEAIRVVNIDLPAQLEMASANVESAGFADRVSHHPVDWLSENPSIPKHADIIWMSQFLDCFSEEEILKILSVCVKSLHDEGRIVIVETFTDKQAFPASQFILEATSLYFTVLANGKSRMYQSGVFYDLIEKAGLEVEETIDLGTYHTMLICKKPN